MLINRVGPEVRTVEFDDDDGEPTGEIVREAVFLVWAEYGGREMRLTVHTSPAILAWPEMVDKMWEGAERALRERLIRWDSTIAVLVRGFDPAYRRDP